MQVQCCTIMPLNPVQNQETSIIRKATANDIDAIVEIEKKCFSPPTAYSKPQLTYLILKAKSNCLVETTLGVLRGFIIVLYRKSSLVGAIETIDVDHSCRSPTSLSMFLALVRLVSPTSESKIISKLSNRSSRGLLWSRAILLSK